MNIITRFENKILSVLKDLPANTIFLAAVSGGADSMAMLTALHSLFQSSILNSQFSIFHCDHGLRSEEESRGDAEFVRAFCMERGIACRVKRIQPGRIASYAKKKGIGIEAAARFFRYRALRAEAARLKHRAQLKQCAQLKQRALLGENDVGGDVCILTAHTKSDLLETTLMRVLRGCGPAGLAGMKTKSKEQRTESKEQIIVRPLIDLSREDVIAYLTAKGISWREDSTNADDLFLRNRIRNRLVPLLNEAFPSWRAGVDAMAETQSLAADFIADEARKRIVWEEVPSDNLSTDEKNFFAQPLIVREEAIFQAADTLIKKVKNPRSVKRVVVRRFCSLTEGESGVKAADFGIVTAKREGGKVFVARKRKEFFESGVSVLIR